MYIAFSLLLIIVIILIIAKLTTIAKNECYKFFKALKLEKSGNITEAQKLYKKFINDETKNLNINSLEYDALVRYSSCLLRRKNNKEISEWIYKYLPVLLNTNNSWKKDDVILEYVLLLNKSKNFSEIHALITNHISNKEDRRLINLYQSTTNSLNKEVNSLIEYINLNVDDPTQSFEILKKIKNSSVLIKYYPDMQGNIKKIEPFLINRLMSSANNADEHEYIFYYMLNHDDILTNIDLLNSAAIFAERIVTKNLIDQKNYKDVISTFLTVVYNDEIFLQNLKNTEWDDIYSISYDNSTGYLRSDNLNDESDIISKSARNVLRIEDARQFLLDDFENTLLGLKDKNTLSQSFLNFFNKEKESIKSIIENIFHYTSDEVTKLAFTPYFGKKFNLTLSLFYEINEEFLNDDDIDLAIPYFEETFGLKEKESNLKAMEYVCADLDKNNIFQSRLRTKLSVQYLTKKMNNDLKSINKLPGVIVDSIRNCNEKDTIQIESQLFNLFENQKTSLEVRVQILEKLLNVMPNSDNIKITLSEAINNEAIHKQEAKLINDYECREMLKKACMIDKENYNAKRNLARSIAFNAVDLAMKRTLCNLSAEISQFLTGDLKLWLTNELFNSKKEFEQYLLREIASGKNFDSNLIAMMRFEYDQTINYLKTIKV